MDDLAKENKPPRHPVKFMDKINSPEKLTAYFDAILISDVKRHGKDNRKELNYSVSALLRTVSRKRPSNYIYHPQLDRTLKQYLVSKWQNQESGYWGAWYLKDDKVVKTDDLSITFHIVSYLKGNVPHLKKIATTTYDNRERPYPFGLLEEGSYTNHHNYDAVKLFGYAWKELTYPQKEKISAEINKMVDWCLSESLQPDGSFRISPADDSLSDAFYFGVSLLDEVGFFNPKKKFWTDRQFPESHAVKEKIRQRIKSIGGNDYMLRHALAKLDEL